MDARWNIRALWLRRGRLGWALLAVLFAVTGCRVGPDYCRPRADVSPNWIDSEHSRLQGEPLDPDQWWNSFGDPVLTNLVARAQRGNLSLREAGMRVLEARAQYTLARGNIWPQTQQINGSMIYSGVSGNRPNFPKIPGFNRNFEDYQLNFYSAAWELDFWGIYRRSIDAAADEWQAATENRRDVLVILLGDLSNAYVDLRTLERRLQLARENAEIQSKTLELVRARLNAGTVTELDFAQSETNLRDTQALIPVLERSHREANNRLCILLGIPPRDLTSEIGHTAVIPNPPEKLALGVPADLLRRRPDIRRVERQLAAQSERIGIAAAQFYPHISISGNIGLEAGDFGKLFRGDSLFGNIGPNFQWNVLNYGRLRSNQRIQEARFWALAYNYRNAVLRANAEVENGLIGFIKSHEQFIFLDQSATAARRASDLAVIRYEGGRADFNEVFLLQSQLVRKLDAAAVSEGEIAKTFILVYRGLGGGWQVPYTDPDFVVNPVAAPEAVPGSQAPANVQPLPNPPGAPGNNNAAPPKVEVGPTPVAPAK